jgi:seryl-tRNA synthetase
MLTIKTIAENREFVISRLAVKNFKAEMIVDKIAELDILKRSLQTQTEKIQAQLNQISKEIGQLFKEGKKEEADSLKEQTSLLKEEMKKYSADLIETENEIQTNIILLPNLPHESVPDGKGADDNQIVKSSELIMSSHEGLIPHWDLAKKYNLIDFELGNKITGSGFPLYLGKAAKLQRSLISFFLDEAINAGYTEVIPPFVVNEDSGFGTGQLPDKEGQMYFIQNDNLYLIPTAEVPVTNIFRDVIVSMKQFPIKYTAYTPCFRREAGSYGKDVRGLNRLHQFDKVEIVRIEHPDNSYNALNEMVNYVESLLIKLNLPYRILRLCGGDMSFTSALTYDFEVFSAGQNRWLEVSSVSNFESYQSNRLKLRYKDEQNKKTSLAHTLNGSALALPRIIASILENNQTDIGIKVPEILIKYTGFELID